jgi:N-acetylmuramic acid 6-phosphate etherase
MKAGTAQKLVLNTLSTAAFVRLGRVYNNWMVDVALTNRKLRERGLRILQEVTGAGAPRAARALAQSGNKMRVALVMLKTGAGAAEARRRLRQAGGELRRALGDRPSARRPAKK